ncbi:MAG: hypothetical protein LAP40_20635 [Acidobacteriia bacterium]|nr:hypothetical protein [Terriglobia bacterium]
MKDEELDRILSGEGGIVPSSGFTAGVMDAIRSEAATPPPIPFPWKRALPGLAAWVVALVAAILGGVSQLGHPAAAAPLWANWAALFDRALEGAEMVGAGWITMALFLAWASVALSMHLTRRG